MKYPTDTDILDDNDLDKDNPSQPKKAIQILATYLPIFGELRQQTLFVVTDRPSYCRRREPWMPQNWPSCKRRRPPIGLVRRPFLPPP